MVNVYGLWLPLFFSSSAQSCSSFLYLRPSHCASSFLAFFGCNFSDGIEYPCWLCLIFCVMPLFIKLPMAPSCCLRFCHLKSFFPIINLTGDAFLDVVAYIFFVYQIFHSILIETLVFEDWDVCGGENDAEVFHMDVGQAMGLAGLCISVLSVFAFDTKQWFYRCWVLILTEFF